MKAVMISIRPEWCEKIANRQKTIEVRKTRPKLKMPFKCYIYCTVAKNKNLTYWMGPRYHYCDGHSHNAFDRIGNGAVIGEFVCDYILPCESMILSDFERQACMKYIEYRRYVGDKCGVVWHISNLKIYGTPKELSEFEVEDREQNKSCTWRQQVYQNPDYNPTGGLIYGGVYCREKSNWCDRCHKKHIKNPPQSWCYVEEMEGEK